MNELPPKTVKAQLVRLDDSLKQIERTQVAGIQRAPGSLPVLEAFQQFLENERRAARRKMWLVMTCAVIIIMGTAAAGVLVLRAHMQRTAQDLIHVSTRTDMLEVALAGVERIGSDDLDALELRFHDESQRIIAQYSELLETQATLAGQIKDGGATLETLEARLTHLESENEQLKNLLVMAPRNQGEATSIVHTGIAMEPELVAERIDSPSPQPADMAMEWAPHEENPDTVPPTKATTVAVIEHPSGRLLTIVPPGQQHGIHWMLPRRFIQE